MASEKGTPNANAILGTVFHFSGLFVVRLILMRIRFRASDFRQVAKINLIRANRNRLLVRNRMRRWCSGHLFARVIQQLGVGTQKIQANVDYCHVWRREKTRRVHFARPWTQASKPALTDSCLAA